MINVAIAGASGYAGRDLIRILLRHPKVRVTALYRGADSEPTHICKIFPEFLGRLDLVCNPLDVNQMAASSDVMFFALPHMQAMNYIPQVIKSGKKIIDLAGDFRLKDRILYTTYYKKDHSCPELLRESVYGLSEIYFDKIKRASLIANPGCYPTSILLGLLPVFKRGLINKDTVVIIDSKSGVSGAGRTLKQELLFCEMNDNAYAYKIGSHQHQPEINQELFLALQDSTKILFTPHIIGIERGIISTMYVPLKEGIYADQIYDVYKTFYADSPFVRLKEKGILPAVKDVANTNFCDIGFYYDSSKNLLVVVSCIDNLIKGAAGSAVQNMNIMCGLDQTTGLL